MHFRYVVFHPFLDEILVGQIKSCSQDGVHGKLQLLEGGHVRCRLLGSVETLISAGIMLSAGWLMGITVF